MIGALWGDLYLTEFQGFTHIQASYINTMLFIGIMIGSPIFGFISSKMGRRKTPLYLGCCLALLSSFLLFLQFHSFIAYISIFFALGFFSSVQGIGYPTIVENNSIDLSGTASAIASILIMSGSAISKVLYGWILNKNWNGAMENKIPLFSHHAFNLAMMTMPIAFTIALISTLFIKETYCNIKR